MQRLPFSPLQISKFTEQLSLRGHALNTGFRFYPSRGITTHARSTQKALMIKTPHQHFRDAFNQRFTNLYMSPTSAYFWTPLSNPINKQYAFSTQSSETTPMEKATYYITKAKNFFVQLWGGLVQLYKNTLEANIIRKKIKQGDHVTRREYRFAQQNRRDLITVAPIFLLIKIPILGKLVLLTVVVRFPWILPSTFKFLKPEVPLRKRLEEGQLYKKIVLPKMKDVKLAKTYAKEITYPLTSSDCVDLVNAYQQNLNLNVLGNTQLSSICAALDISGWGFNSMLRNRILRHMEKVQHDDKFIVKETVESLTEEELEEAAKERGLVADLTFDNLKKQMKAWLDLSSSHPDKLLPLIIYHHGYDNGHLALK